MSADGSIEQLSRDVQYLKDRLAITDCVMRHARGVDRHDADLVTSCYHDDAFVGGHGARLIPGPEYGEWSNGAHANRFSHHAHHISTATCEIDGDTAYCESYVIGSFLAQDQQRASFVSARYIDQLERRDGEWRILARRAITDIAIEGDASFLGAFRGQAIDPKQFWTKDDLSYQRPIDLQVAGPPWH